MVRINLLPPEIVERRRYERFFKYVYVAAGVIAVVLIGAWLLLGMQISERNRDLQSRQELANKLRAEADAFAVFEQKQADLDARKAIAAQALAGRIDWSRICTEISMVLPSDVWTTNMVANQDAGMNFAFVAQDSDDSPDVGLKTVAQTIVRLNDLDSLFDVWLKAATKEVQQVGETSSPQITFQLTSQVVKPASANATAAPSVPAPPPSGQ